MQNNECQDCEDLRSMLRLFLKMPCVVSQKEDLERHKEIRKAAWGLLLEQHEKLEQQNDCFDQQDVCFDTSKEKRTVKGFSL